MKIDDNLKITMLVDGKPVYFGAPMFLSQKRDGDGVTLILQTEIGMQTKQKFELHIKQPTYVESFTTTTSGDPTLGSDTKPD